jgi:predicted transcriptional regulator
VVFEREYVWMAAEAADGAGHDIDTFLADVRERLDSGESVEVPIRTLIHHVGAERRGVRVVDQVQAALARHGLATEPSVAAGWVDSHVALQLAHGRSDPRAAQDGSASEAQQAPAEEVSLTVRNLQAATSGVKSVQRNSDLQLARAYMLRYDYSQLAVMAGERRVVGAVSWESMALAALRDPAFTLADATIPVRQVDPGDDLIELIPTIAENGFVLVVGPDQRPSGIVTTADLSMQFRTLAGPFLVIGEIERRLRSTLASHFSVGELAQVRDPVDTNRTIDSANDLTLGETLRMFEDPNNWVRLGWPVDRPEFVKALNDVKSIRNDVMHFSPDPLSGDQQDALNNFVGWLRAMERVAPG